MIFSQEGCAAPLLAKNSTLNQQRPFFESPQCGDSKNDWVLVFMELVLRSVNRQRQSD